MTTPHHHPTGPGRQQPALATSEDRFRLLVTATSDVVYRMSPDWSEMWRLDGREFIEDTDEPSRTWLERYIPTDDRPRVLEAIADAIRRRCVFELEHPVVRVDGSFGWTSSRAIPVLDARGDITEWLGTASDVTRRKEAEASLRMSEERLRLAACAAGFGYYDADLITGEVYWSTEMRILLGLEIDGPTVSVGSVPDFVHPEDRDRVQERIRASFDPGSGGTFEDEHRIERPDGSIRWVLLKGNTLFSGGGDRRRPIRATGVLLDITGRKEAEARLRASEERFRLSEERFRAFMDNSPAAAWMSDSDGRIVYLSRTYRGMFLLPEGEVIGRSCFDLYPEDIAGRYVENMRAAAKAGGPVECIEPGIRRDGSEGQFLVYKFPLTDPGGPLIGGVAVDITAQREAERRLLEQEERYRLLAEANPIGIVHATMSGAILFCNEAYCRITGYLKDDFTSGRVGWATITPPEWLAVDEARIAEAKAKGFCEPYEKEYTRKDGTRVPVVVGFAFLDEVQEQAAAFILDVSAQKRAEAERERLVEQLKDADRRKTEFLMMLAHELRNPLAAVDNATTVLKLSAEPENLAFARDIIVRQTRQFARLIDDLLDVSRITSGKIRLRREPCDAGTILKQAVEATMPLIDERGHRLEIEFEEGTLPLQADATRVGQIVINLLTNAAKYSEDGGRIRLGGKREGDHVVITVADEGVGIPPDKLPEMFELFAQGERSIARSEGGLGLGLTIVQRLAEMHGGSVSARSDGPGMGSTFTVRIPAATPAAQANGRPATPVPAGRYGARILVVDDNADTARSLVRLLKLLGNEAEAAHEGPSALDVARVMRPEFVLLDIGLPGMDGYEVARRLRDDPHCRASVIIALSGYGQDEDRRRSREAGFDHHLVKPVEIEVLLSLLSQAWDRGK